jgi:hypothetical protein
MEILIPIPESTEAKICGLTSFSGNSAVSVIISVVKKGKGERDCK